MPPAIGASVASMLSCGLVELASATQAVILSTATEAVKPDPRHMRARIDLGYVQQEVGDLCAAANHYREAIAAFDPELLRACAHNNLGAILNQQGGAGRS